MEILASLAGFERPEDIQSAGRVNAPGPGYVVVPYCLLLILIQMHTIPSHVNVRSCSAGAAARVPLTKSLRFGDHTIMPATVRAVLYQSVSLPIDASGVFFLLCFYRTRYGRPIPRVTSFLYILEMRCVHAVQKVWRERH